jgi:hypothetical protein
MYSLTKAGELFLGGWIEALQNYQKVLQQAMVPFEAAARGGAGEEENDD